MLPGIPTIRPFEALACGIPLVCSPWDDVEGLFTPGRDFLVARDGKEMTNHLRALIADEKFAQELADHGLRTIWSRHTCAHRVSELLAIDAEVRKGVATVQGSVVQNSRSREVEPSAYQTIDDQHKAQVVSAL